MKQMDFIKRITGLVGLIFMLGSFTANAASINYGDFIGNTAAYGGVTESSTTDSVPLFGSPTITADSLRFAPTGFTASASDGSSDITNGQLNFDVEALTAAGIPGLTVSEFGDYTLAGTGSTATSVSVGISVFATITEVDGAPITPFTVNASTSSLYDLVNNAGITVPWSSGVSIDFNLALSDEGISYTSGVTEFEFVMNNQLLAISETGTIAFISKKGFQVDLQPTVVPVPAAFWLFGSGLIGLVGIARRKKAA
jgi:hypothetical protein